MRFPLDDPGPWYNEISGCPTTIQANYYLKFRNTWITVRHCGGGLLLNHEFGWPRLRSLKFLPIKNSPPEMFLPFFGSPLSSNLKTQKNVSGQFAGRLSDRSWWWNRFPRKYCLATASPNRFHRPKKDVRFQAGRSYISEKKAPKFRKCSWKSTKGVKTFSNDKAARKTCKEMLGNFIFVSIKQKFVFL